MGGSIAGTASATQGLRLVGVRPGFRQEGCDRHVERLGQAVEQVDGGIALFPFKFAHPGSVDSSISRQPLL
ncbi:MAG: hypothetical protein ABS78_02560 [Phenylobacterium sp. SCN 70-31]|nr:MAG: hypothetical protein ABS78_02560 [Phenylobacterium sp. SCN 70-31]